MAAQNKKGFDFRMSKKVAELTQVVHMLFQRNHEKEMEMEALRDAYEYEIELVMTDAKNQIQSMEAKLKNLERNSSSDKVTLKTQMDAFVAQKEKEYKEATDALDKQLQEEKRECQNVRDLLIRAQQDIEQLRSNESQETSKLSAQIQDKDKELASLKAKLNILEKQQRHKESQSIELKDDLQKVNERLQKENFHLREGLTDVSRTKDQLIAKTKSLELEVRALKRELSRRLPEKPQPERQAPPSAGFIDYKEEIERLRQEVKRYRMELFNREGNFNRVFSNQNPVVVERRGNSKLGGRLGRERTVPSFSSSYNTGGHAMEEDVTELHTPRSAASSASSHRMLPNLDARARLQRLVKPKPLPRELLSGKTGATH